MSLIGNISDSNINRNRALRIACAGEKGGGGKTTISIHTAFELTRRGFKVVIVDNDPQNGISNWVASMPVEQQLTVINIVNDLKEKDLELLDSQADVVIIDGSPGFDVDTRLIDAHGLLSDLTYDDSIPSATRKMIKDEFTRIFGTSGNVYAKSSSIVNLVDFVILPTKASNQDLVPLVNYVKRIIEPRMESAKDVFYGVVHSQVGAGKRNTTMKVTNTLQRYNFSSFESEITHRESYAKASWGDVVQQQSGKDKDNVAIEEVAGLVDEIIQLFKLEK